MIKMPKSLDELKQLVNEVPINEVFEKVKSGINSATDMVKGATKTPYEDTGAISQDLARMHSLHKELGECLARLSANIGYLQEQLTAQQIVNPNSTASSKKE